METRPVNPARNAFLAARDFLLEHRSDQPTAARDFRWPVLDEFNWALDHFERSPKATSGPRCGSSTRTAASRSARSSRWPSVRTRWPTLLRRQGVKRGDRILLILGNELALWESMLERFKLGAVMIPATALLTPEDLRDRIERGHVRHVIAGSAHAPKFAALEGSYTRICVGAAQPGWLSFDLSQEEPRSFEPEGATKATDPLLLYFTSGTTSKPKLVLHTHQSYPVGHLSTMFWIGLQPGDIHLNISSPGWAKHAWSCFFAPWNAGACIFIHNVARFDAARLLQTSSAMA